MLRRRIRSALYIDFENVPLPPDAIANWLAWLEDGAFESIGRRRRFLQKRVYWNSHAERNRDLFQKHGFVPILVGKFAGLKNGADIRMAMDVIEATYTRSEIDEFILLTGDSDFVPVLERLREKAKLSAIVATEHRPNIHTTYQLNADVLIPSRRLTEAAQYRRTQRSWRDMIWSRPAVRQPVSRADAPAQPAAATKLAPQPRNIRQPAVPTPPPDPASLIEAAARRVLKLLVQQPRNYVAQKRVLADLDRMQGFKRQGPTAYLGIGTYKALMKELARIEPRITVIDQPGGGTGVVFIPPTPPPAAEGLVSLPALAPAATEQDGHTSAVREPQAADEALPRPASALVAGSQNRPSPAAHVNGAPMPGIAIVAAPLQHAHAAGGTERSDAVGAER